MAYGCVSLLRIQHWAFSSLSHPLSLGQVQHFTHPATVCVLLLFTVWFQFHRSLWFWMLLIGSGDQLCDPLPAMLWGVGNHLPALILCCHYCVYLLRVQSWVLLIALPIFSDAGLVCHPSTPHCAVCARLQFTVCFSVLLEGIRLPWGCAGLCSWGWIGSPVFCGVHLFVLSIDTQAGLEPAVVGRNGINFFQCSMVRRISMG
jgi:hypothetical protein